MPDKTERHRAPDVGDRISEETSEGLKTADSLGELLAAEARRLIRALQANPPEVFRRYFVNTIFDSTFVVLGILAAVSAEPQPDVDFAIGTLLAACLAIGISTGVSVYEAERTEGQIRIDRLERAMLTRLGETQLSREIRTVGLAVATVNFLAPLVVATITVTPLLLYQAGVLPNFPVAASASSALGLGIVFGSGYILARIAGRTPWRKAVRMTIIAILTFAGLLLLERAL